MKISYLDAIDKYLDGVEAGVRELFPIESNRKTLALEGIDVDRDAAKDAAQNLKAQVEAKLTDSSITIPMYGTLVLTDNETGKVIDKKRRKLLDAPVMTKRLTFMVNGGDYNVMKQFRLKPGIYTRAKENGDVESFFNMSKGGRVKVAINLNPENNSFSIGLGNANPKLYPVLKALGVSDKTMEGAWGKELFQKNKLSDSAYEQNVKKAYRAVMKADANPKADLNEMTAGIKDFFESTGMSPETTKITLGKGFDSVTPEALVTTSNKLLKVSRGEVKPDARDSLFFKEIFDVDELVKARIKAFKYEISKKVKNNLDKKEKISDIFSKDFISKPINSFITQSGLSTVSEAVNPISMLNAATKTTIMGEGGLGSLDAVTTSMRSVDSSHAGFLDPIQTPESNRIGINLNLAVGSSIEGKNLYTTVIDVKSKGPVKKTSADLMDHYVAFPDQYDKKNNKWNFKQIRCMRRGEIVEVSPSKVEFIMPNAQAMFSISSNLMPFLANTQGNRAMMGNKMFGQAVPLVHREAPLVQVKFGKASYEDQIRNLYAVNAPVGGTVSAVTKDEVVIKDKSGKSHSMGLYNNFSLAGKSFIHNTAAVKAGDTVKKGDLLADDNFSRGKTLALGTNLNTAFMPFQDKTFEDGIPISESAAIKLTSEHLFEYKESISEKDLSSVDTYKKQFPGIITPSMEGKLDGDGIIREGTEVDPGDILMPLLRHREPTEEDKSIGKLSKMLITSYRDASLKWAHDYKGKVVRVKRHGDAVIIQVKAERPAEVGDKLAGRYGNKGVITAIIPDDEMPVTKDGKRVDLFITPLSVQGRINTGQVLETTAGRVAQKRNVPIKINNFSGDFKSDEEIKRLAEKHGIKTTERLFDPKTGRDLGEISMGPQYILKLKYMVDKKMTARGPRASYNADLQPTKGGSASARALDRLTWNGLVAHGARENLREMSTYKSEKNPELWNAVRLGMPLPAPKTPFVVNKMFNLMAAGGINVKKEGNQLQLTPMTDSETLNRSNGEIDDAQVIMAKNLRPVRDGLFDDAKTGGLAGSKWTHITLAEPIVNPVMEKAIKSLLGITGKEFDGLVAGTMSYDGKLATIVTGEGAPGTITGGTAFKRMLSKIDIKKEIRQLNDEAMGARGPALDKINKRLRYLTSLKNLGLTPESAYMLKHLPVLPPNLRPMYPLPDGTIVSSPINFLYRDAIMVNKELKNGGDLPGTIKTKLRKDLFNSVKAVQGLGKPILVRKEKDLKGALELVKGDSPKTGYFQSVVFSKKQELTGSSTIAPSVDISPDEVLLPKKMAWNMYEPFAMKELINMGYKATEAAKMVANKDSRAEIALEKAVAKRPTWINRAPSLHKFNVLAVQPKLYEGNAIKLHPLVFGGFNADNDGDTMGMHVPISQAAVDEARRFTPSKVLESPRDGSIMLQPSMDIQIGVFLITAKGKPKPYTYSSAMDAKKDFYRNKIDVTSVVTIAGKKTTLGRALLREVLPSDVIIPSDGVTKKNLSDFMKDIVAKHRKDFNEIMGKLSKLASEFSYQSGVSLTIDDLKTDNKIIAPIKDEIRKKFSGIKTKQGKIDFLVKVNEKLDKDNIQWIKDNKWNNNLALTAVAAGKPGVAALKQLKFMPLILKDPQGSPVAVPITRSYANGLTSSDYWAASYGARSGMIDRALQTSEPGYFAKQLLSVVDKEVVSAEDCGTKDGVVISIKDKDKMDFLWRYVAGTNHLIDDTYYKQLKALGRPVKVRSPLTCELAEGVCSKCYGNHEDGNKSQIGDNIGMVNGQSITERGTQLTMRTFHTGSVVESGGGYATSGMTRLKQLTNLPQFISGKSALSTVDGKVKSITPNPAGGVNIVVKDKNNEDVNHFGVISKADVSVGQQVKVGDKLTAGTIQPKELLDLTGVRNTQDHLVDELDKAYRSQGVSVNRRAFETVIRGTTNTTKVLKPVEGSGYLPGDKTALTKVLAWNRKNPNTPITHKPVLLGMDFAAKVGENWLGKLNTTRLLQTLQEGTAAGERSDIHSYSPVTPYVVGTSFGKGPNGKY